MTPDDPRDPRPDATGPQPSPDELASALLDGELSDGEAVAARARPEVVARAAEMAEARRALRELPVPPHAGRDRAVAAALAAFDDERAHDGATSAVGGGGHRSREPVAPPVARGAPTRRTQRWLAAAAAAAVLAGLAGLAVATDDDRADQDAAGSAADEATEGEDDGHAGGSAVEGGPADDRAAAEEAPLATADTDLIDELGAAGAGDLGTFPSADEFVDHMAALLAGDGGEGPVPPVDADGGADTAFRQACADDPPAPPADALATVLGGRAVIDGRPVGVWVVDTAEGRRVIALDDSCSVVVDRPLG